MRLSLGFGLLGVGLSLAIAMPLAAVSVEPAAAQTASAPAARNAPAKRPAAKAKEKAAEAGKPTPAETDRLLDSAAKSLAEGKPDAATTTLDGVLAGGGLNNTQMARALYLRGVTHRRKGRQAQAIADLTSAIWLKGGLSEADRNAALKERSEVSREVGVADTPPPEGSERIAASERPSAPAESPQARGASPAQSAPARLFSAPPSSPSPDLSEGGFPRAGVPASRPARVARAEPAAAPTSVATPDPVAAAPAPPAPPRVITAPLPVPSAPAPKADVAKSAAPSRILAAPPPAPSGELSEGGFPRAARAASRVATPPQPLPPTEVSEDGFARKPPARVADAPARETAKPGWVPAEDRSKSPQSSAPAGGSGVGQFFTGLFGGSQPPPSSSPAPRATRTAEVSAWSTSTSARGPAGQQAKPKTDAIVTSAASQPATAAPSGSGGFRLQIATVRSRTEAEAVAARVRKDHKGVVGARALDIDQTVFGNMGTFYRVRLGPFAAASEPKALCDQLRTSGYDCLVVSQ
jgi:hypothetical protein